MRGQDIDRLAEAHPACHLVAFADLTSGITFRAAGAARLPREALDGLCGDAARLLGLAPPAARFAVRADGDGIFLAMRGADEGDGLFALCSDPLALGPFLADAQSALSALPA